MANNYLYCAVDAEDKPISVWNGSNQKPKKYFDVKVALKKRVEGYNHLAMCCNLPIAVKIKKFKLVEIESEDIKDNGDEV